MGKLLNSYQFTVNRHLESRLGNVLAHVMQAYDGKVVRLTVEEWPDDPQPTLAEIVKEMLARNSTPGGVGIGPDDRLITMTRGEAERLGAELAREEQKP